MWKIFLSLFLISQPAWAITNQWRGGVGTQELDGTQNAALIGTNSYNHIVQPLDNLLSTYCNEYLVYASSSTITVHSGSCMVSNSQGTIRLTLLDTTNTTISSSNLDTGALASGTTYYVYSTAATNAATTSTYYISTSNTAPSGQTYYYQIGNFATDGSTNIQPANISNKQPYSGITTNSVYNYGTSASSFTNVSSNLRIAYGNTGTIGWGTCSGISNLPFTSGSSYTAVASSASGNSSQNFCTVSSLAASTMSVCVASVPSGSNINASCNWIAIGN